MTVSCSELSGPGAGAGVGGVGAGVGVGGAGGGVGGSGVGVGGVSDKVVPSLEIPPCKDRRYTGDEGYSVSFIKLAQ
ncbi:MAG: hypothetical protein WC110_07725 [Bacteroidales bacterium]